MVMKLAEVLTRPYFADKLDRLRREAIIGRTRVSSEVMTPDPSVSGITDDDEDDAVLLTAVAAGADYLVTGDTTRLKLRSYREVQIVTAREFLTLLES
jgi:predicted nucleic acid-binding protein